MWLAVSIINPLMAFAIVAVIPIATVGDHQESLLSFMGNQTGGKWLSTFISIDAVMVLSGAVLTSYVGVTGLMKRMTLDRILPQLLIKENKNGSSPRILILFFLLCISVLSITKGELGPLAGVYTISFLLVMAYFGVGNFLLKIKRQKLPRPETAKTYLVAVAVLAIIVAIYGNISIHPEYLVVFLNYFVPSIIIISLLLNRKVVLQYFLLVLKSFMDNFYNQVKKGEIYITNKIHTLTHQEFVYFSKGDDIAGLNKVIQYVQENEITSKLKIVTVVNESVKISEDFMRDFDALDRAYPEIDLFFEQIVGTFNPDLINELSKKWKIPTNFMFISSPSNKFSYRLSELNGVRLIM